MARLWCMVSFIEYEICWVDIIWYWLSLLSLTLSMLNSRTALMKPSPLIVFLIAVQLEALSPRSIITAVGVPLMTSGGEERRLISSSFDFLMFEMLWLVSSISGATLSSSCCALSWSSLIETRFSSNSLLTRCALSFFIFVICVSLTICAGFCPFWRLGAVFLQALWGMCWDGAPLSVAYVA